ncbi:MAG: hypothetical protein PSX80_15690 [bacterium]|nr:hypothetical protein [bacterium]
MVVTVSVTVALMIVFALAAKAQADVNARGGCPSCRTRVPRYRTPASLRQALWGGWTCENCGTEMDRHGMELTRAVE